MIYSYSKTLGGIDLTEFDLIWAERPLLGPALP